MAIILYIICGFWASFLIMLIIISLAPEYIEDESGNLIPKNKKKNYKVTGDDILNTIRSPLSINNTNPLASETTFSK
jgi:hypothetical protein